MRTVIKIITRHELDLNELQDKDLINVNITPSHLNIKCQPEHSLLLLAIKNEFEDFIKDFTKKNLVKSPTEIFRLEESQDQNGVSSLTVVIHDEQLYKEFVSKLNKDNLLPSQVKTPQNTKDSSYRPSQPS